jgi:hypothetical protein
MPFSPSLVREHQVKARTMMGWASIPFLGDIDETDDDKEESTDERKSKNNTPETLDLTPLSFSKTTVSTPITPKRLFPKTPNDDLPSLPHRLPQFI